MTSAFTDNPLLSQVDTSEVLVECDGGESASSSPVEQLTKSRSKINQRILIFTCTVFFLFVIAEVFGAFTSGSLSLLGDAGAMSVDVFTVCGRSFVCLMLQLRSINVSYHFTLSAKISVTNIILLNLHCQYMCNIIAERLKATYADLSLRTQFIIEIVIPTFSVICLLGITIYVTVDAVHVLSSTSGAIEPVKVNYLYGFAVANLFIDFVSTCIFFVNGSSKEHVFFTSTVNKTDCRESSALEGIEQPIDNDLISTSKIKKRMNLNMVSAFTHLTGDSMRSVSVLIAALVSSFSGIQSEICDAWAAISVTVTIVIMIIPLVIEICKASIKYGHNMRKILCCVSKV